MPYILYLGIFLIPFLYNPWGGANPYEIAKHAFLLGFVGLSSLIFIIILWRKSQFSFYYNKVIFWVLSLWGFSYILSQIFGVAPIESFWGSFERFHGTLTYIYYAIHILLCLIIFRREHVQQIFFYILFYSGLILGIYGISQFFGFDPLRFSEKTLFGDRVFATLGSPNFLGQFLIFTIIAGWYFALHTKRIISKIFYIFADVVMLSALYLTYNRASWLGLFVAFLIGAILWFRHYYNTPTAKRKIFIVAAFLVIIIGGLGFHTYSKLRYADTRSLNSRFILWSSALSASYDQLLFGSGLETISERLMPKIPKELYHFESLNHIPDRTHNEILDILLTRGLLGVALYLVSVGFLLWILWKKKLHTPMEYAVFLTIVAYTISVQFGFSMTSHIITLLAFWAILLISTLEWRQINLRPGASTKVIYSIVLLLFSIFSFSESGNRLATDNLFPEAIHAYFQDEKKALSVWSKLISHSPYYIYPFNSIFILYQDFAFDHPEILPQLKQYTQSVSGISPRHFQAQLMRAQVNFWEGDFDEAEMQFAAVMNTVPSWPWGWYVWGKSEFKAKRFGAAITAFEHLRRVAPPYETWDSERQRIFQISNFFFFEGMRMLSESYAKLTL